MPFALTRVRAAALCLLALLFASTVHAQDLPASELPVPEEDLHVSRSSYLVTVAMNGQQMEMNVTHEIEDVEEGWRVTETAESPMGEAIDVEVLNREVLTPISRTVTQGPMRIDLSYSDSTVGGTIQMQGNEQAVDIALDGPIYSDGAAANLVIAALPLAEGYHAEYQTLDLMQQRRRQMQIEVAGVDSVDVPAGSFQTFRVEISSAEGGQGGTTLWVDQESRLVVRAETSVPQLDGATLTSELQSSSRLEE